MTNLDQIVMIFHSLVQPAVHMFQTVSKSIMKSIRALYHEQVYLYTITTNLKDSLQNLQTTPLRTPYPSV